MTQAQLVTADDVVRALGESEQVPAGSPKFEVFAPFIGHLIELMGDDLNTLVTMSKLCEATARYMRWLAENKEFLGKLDPLEAALMPELFSEYAESLDRAAGDPQAVLANVSMTEAEFMGSPLFNVSDEARRLYQNGKLTFAGLLGTSPSVFLPDN